MGLRHNKREAFPQPHCVSPSRDREEQWRTDTELEDKAGKAWAGTKIRKQEVWHRLKRD